MSVESLRELQDMAMKLRATARKLPLGLDRQKVIEEIGRFRRQISAMQNRPSSEILKTNHVKGRGLSSDETKNAGAGVW